MDANIMGPLTLRGLKISLLVDQAIYSQEVLRGFKETLQSLLGELVGQLVG